MVALHRAVSQYFEHDYDYRKRPQSNGRIRVLHLLHSSVTGLGHVGDQADLPKGTL